VHLPSRPFLDITYDPAAADDMAASVSDTRNDMYSATLIIPYVSVNPPAAIYSPTSYFKRYNTIVMLATDLRTNFSVITTDLPIHAALVLLPVHISALQVNSRGYSREC
jgi:hypothetical protein